MAASLMHIWDTAHGELDYDHCRTYGRQVVEGLRHLHREGLAHRDLTLTSVLVDSRSNSVKVADSGLAVCSRNFVLSRPVSQLSFYLCSGGIDTVG
jgi:serine/threonine protein kinase